MIVKFVTVDMMDVKLNAIVAAILATMATRPLVTVLDSDTDIAPLSSILSAQFPLFVLDCPCTPRLGNGSSLDTMLVHGFENSSGAYAECCSDFLKGMKFDAVGMSKPFGVMVQGFWSVVTWCVTLPKALFANPLDRQSASTSAKWRFAFRLISWLVYLVSTGLNACAALIPLTVKGTDNKTRSTAEISTGFIVGWIASVIHLRPVEVANFTFLFVGKCTVSAKSS